MERVGAASGCPFLELLSIVWADNQFVAVGRNGAIVTSPDAVRWSVAKAISEENLVDIVWTGTRLVAVGFQQALVSSNGIDWDLHTVPNADFAALTVTPNGLVAVGYNGGVFTSDEGRLWRYDSIFNRDFYDITWADDRLTAVGEGGAIATSPDGRAWTLQPSITSRDLFAVAASTDQTIAVGDYSKIIADEGNVDNWLARSTGFAGIATDVIWADGEFILVDDLRTFYSSPNGIQWTERSQLQDSSFRNLAWSGDVLVALFDDILFTSADRGTSWLRSDDLAQRFDRVVWAGDRFIVVGVSHTAASSDGIDWTVVPNDLGGFENRLRDLHWTGSELLGVSRRSVFRSTDGGVRWVQQFTGQDQTFNAIAHSPKAVVVVGDVIVTSPDATRWSILAQPEIRFFGLNDVLFDGQQFVAVGDDDQLLLSNDGVDWRTSQTGLAHRPEHLDLARIVWSGAEYLIASDNYGNVRIANCSAPCAAFMTIFDHGFESF